MERGILNLINYGDHSRWAHVIICLTEAGEFAKQISAPNCRIIELHKQAGNDVRIVARLAAAARKNDIHIFHARGWPTLVETALASRLANVRRTVYGFHGKTMSELSGLSPARAIAQAVFIRAYDKVVTLNGAMCADLARQARVNPAHIRVIGNGVDVGRFCPVADRRSSRVALGLPTDRFIVGTVSRLDPIKNHEVILRAIALLQSSGSAPFLVIVGEGEHRPALEALVRDLKISDSVRLTGFSNAIPEFMKAMDCYVQASFYEGFSNTVLEAMACGLPVLATDVGGTREFLCRGHDEVFFAPHDVEALAGRLCALQLDEATCHRLGRANRTTAVDRYSVEQMVRAYEAMYEELAGI